MGYPHIVARNNMGNGVMSDEYGRYIIITVLLLGKIHEEVVKNEQVYYCGVIATYEGFFVGYLIGR